MGSAVICLLMAAESDCLERRFWAKPSLLIRRVVLFLSVACLAERYVVYVGSKAADVLAISRGLLVVVVVNGTIMNIIA